MKKVKHETKIKEIPLENLYLEKAQVRNVNVGKDIKELADSIRKVGLIEPIIVGPADKDGKHEIYAGQRRFLAHHELGEKTIKAVVTDHHLEEIEAKVISLTENMVRLELPQKDLIDVCTFLYKRYGSIKCVAEETGLSYPKVSQYVKYDRLIPKLKAMVDEGLDVNVALKAQDAASVTGEPKADVATTYAKEMKTMSGEQRKRVLEESQKDPEKPAEEVLEEAKAGKQIVQLRIQLGPKLNEALQKYSMETHTPPEEAASNLIEEQLKKEGFFS